MENVDLQIQACFNPRMGICAAIVSQAAPQVRHADMSSISSRRLIGLTIILSLAVIMLFPLSTRHDSKPRTVHDLAAFQPLRATLPAPNKKRPDPVRWLQENSNNRYAVSKGLLPQFSLLGSSRPRAALISLARNSELEGMMQSMRQLEFRWNRKYQVRALFQKQELN